MLTIIFLAVLFTIPSAQIPRLWPVGVISMIVLYAIDSTLIGLGAFSYSFGNPGLAGIPLIYWLSSFPGGLLLVYLYPEKPKQQLPYIMLASAVFLAAEMVMSRLGYFLYLNWNSFYSYLLNVGGFIIVIWLSQLTGCAGKKNHPLRGDSS